MPTSNRVLNGSKTRGSTSTPIGVESISGREFDEQRQGINLRTTFDQTSALFLNLKSNASEINTLNGKDLSENIFDESIATVNFVSSSDNTANHISTVNIGAAGKLSSRLSHRHERLDLGQTLIYEDSGPYYDTQELDPVYIISTPPILVELPPALADHNSMSSMDGVIDIFSTRRKIERSTVEAPYYARGVRGSIGQIEDSYRRSNEISAGLNTTTEIPEKYLDSDEKIGVVISSKFYGVSIQGFHSDEAAKITPFSEVFSENDRSRFYESSTVDNEMKYALINMSSSSLNNYQTHDKMSLSGYRYENNSIGVDSLAFGGLLR